MAVRKPAQTYRRAALALLLSFALGAALPALCQHGAMAAGHSSGMAGFPAAPCAGTCHISSGQAVQGPEALVAVMQRLPSGPEVLPPAPLAAAMATSLSGSPAAGARFQSAPVRAGPPPLARPVRLHVYHAVFLN